MKTKVLIVTDDYGHGGAAEYTHRLALALHAQDFEVVYVQPAQRTAAVDHREAVGIRHRHFGYDPLALLGHSYRDRAFPAAVLMEERPDFVLFSDCLPESLVAAKEACAFLDIRFGVVKHYVAPDTQAAKLPDVRAKITAVLRQAAFVVCVSEENAGLLRDIFDLPDVRVVYNGRPDSFFAPRSAATRRALRDEWRVPQDATLVFTAAQIEPRKGFQYQLQALYVLKEANLLDGLYFVWAGAVTPFALQLEDALDELGCRDHVRLVGRRSDIADCLDAADIFLLPSEREGMPLAVLEAMAKGVPVVATAVSGIPEALAGGTGALLSDPNRTPKETVMELARVLSRWKAETAEREAVGAAGKARADTLFRETRTYGQMGDFIRIGLFPPDDYVSPGLRRIRADAHFPFLWRGSRGAASSPWIRRDIPHGWYVDIRKPDTGFLTRDEAHLLHNAALPYAGRPALEIGFWFGWSTFHLAAAGVVLDTIDPGLAEPLQIDTARQALVGLPDAQVSFLPGESPATVRTLAEREGRRWSLFFISCPGDDAVSGHAAECARWAQADALVLIHGLAAPAAAEGLRVLQRLGWRTRIYDTAQIMGCAWRGTAEPPAHIPDPAVRWSRPAHLGDLGTE
ncbi:glycosyltransferase [Arenibaculum pallidiluteum]|uniref:glycosyltransferase n=1 Tax=Arenibaculum pallidiluteum TaxID=2812559 RepID=UPI001A96E061|nr:glycosyltransferase [Arenibaculum pallidiluteum]